MVNGKQDSMITPKESVTKEDSSHGFKDKSSNIPPNGKTRELYY